MQGLFDRFDDPYIDEPVGGGAQAEGPERAVFWPRGASAAREDFEGVPDAIREGEHFRAARAALRRGLSVIPVRPDKRPLGRWSEYQTRPPTEQEFESWRQQNPSGWAIVTGAVSGCIVLDFDGEEGLRTLERLQLEPHIWTPSGGAHVYVAHPGWRVSTQNHGANRTLQKAFPGMDIKGDGGYAIAFGRSTQGEYRGNVPQEFLPFEKLPPELRHALTGGLRGGPDSPQNAPAALQGLAGGLRDRLVERALDRARTDGRNNALLWLACQLRDSGVDEDETLRAAEEFASLAPQTNAKGTEGPLSFQEIQATVRSAFSRPPREPLGGASDPPGDRLTAHRDTLKELLSGSVRWCQEWKSWLRWDGGRWEKCPEEKLHSDAYEALRQRYLKMAQEAEDKGTRAWAAVRLHEVEGGRYYREALELLKGAAGVLTRSSEFDRDPHLLNTPSGVVDLRTGELRPARPEDLMTKTTGVPYDPQADCPEFFEFLKEILPQEGLPEFLQLILGSGLLGENRFHKSFIFYGSGANGKSTLLKVIQGVAGDYAGAIPRDALLTRRQ